METPETIAPAEAAMTPAAAEVQPWVMDCPAPAMRRQAESVHWGVALLTALTAMMILFQAYGHGPSEPRELLPIVIDAR